MNAEVVWDAVATSWPRVPAGVRDRLVSVDDRIARG